MNNPFILQIDETKRFKVVQSTDYLHIANNNASITKTLHTKKIQAVGGFLRISVELIDMMPHFTINTQIVMLKVLSNLKFNSDYIILKQQDVPLTTKEYKTSIKQLINAKILIRKQREHYYINPFLLYKGDILKLYLKYKHLKKLTN